jgi:hypothetical protein
MSWNRSVSKKTKYAMHERFLFPEAANIFLRHRVQTGSGAHPVLYSMATEGKVAEA